MSRPRFEPGCSECPVGLLFIQPRCSFAVTKLGAMWCRLLKRASPRFESMIVYCFRVFLTELSAQYRNLPKRIIVSLLLLRWRDRTHRSRPSSAFHLQASPPPSFLYSAATRRPSLVFPISVVVFSQVFLTFFIQYFFGILELYDRPVVIFLT